MKGILVKKINSEPGDATLNGTFGKAVLWANTPEEMKNKFPDVEKMYTVVWDNKPMLALATISTKIDIIDNTPVECKIHEHAEQFAKSYREMIPNFNYFE